MATYMRQTIEVLSGKIQTADRSTLQCDNCTEFDADGFALPEGRCWVPLWADGLEAPKPEGPDRCSVCSVPLIGRL